MAAHVSVISTTPVKGLGLVHPEAVELGHAGVAHDRRFHLVDESGRLANGKSFGPLVTVAPALSDDGRVLGLRFPDGRAITAEVELGEAVTTSFYGTDLPGRLVEGPWAAALSAFAGLSLRVVRVDDGSTGVDRGTRAGVSLQSVASLQRLASEAGVQAVDGRRFRMLFTLDGVAAHEEDAWLGRAVRIGDAVVRPLAHVGRCAVTTHDPDTGVPSLDTLRSLRSYRSDVPSEEALPFGVWGEVVEPGRVRLGDPVALLAG